MSEDTGEHDLEKEPSGDEEPHRILHAAFNLRARVLRSLLARNISAREINFVGRSGATALHFVSTFGHEEMALALAMDARCDVLLKNALGFRASEIANQNGHVVLAHKLSEIEAAALLDQRVKRARLRLVV